MVIGIAGLVLFVFLFGLMDLWLQYGRFGRAVIWILLMAAAIAASWWIKRTLQRKFKAVAVAAMMERAFPQLDNHLINYLQFAADPGDDPFKRAYVRRGAPSWSGLDLREMKNRKMHQRALYGLLVAAVLFLTPGAFLGKAWGVAVWRVVNPFANTPPATLTNILGVDPGNTTVLQGSPLVLSCRVLGYDGHKVTVDVEPADGEQTTYALGEISGSEEQEFTYRIPKVNTEVRYRFRAGDSPFPEWYTVDTRPPLGFTELRVAVTPPAYTKQDVREYDALAEDITVPAGSTLRLRVRSNLPVAEASVARGREKLPLRQSGDATAWQGEWTITDASPLKLVAVGKSGDKADQWVRFTYEPDRLPGINVISPEGRPVLPPGAVPSISFEVTDDYGLGDLVIEQVHVGSSRNAKGEVLQTWNLGGDRGCMRTWEDKTWHSREEKTLAYRILARDNYPNAAPERMARSSTIVFYSSTAAEAADKRNEIEKENFSSLATVIELQRGNLAKTESYQKTLNATIPANWEDAADVQRKIREITKQLLNSPINPLGNLTSTAKKLYLNEMANVIPLLASVPKSTTSVRETRVAQAVSMERKILRQLTFAEVSAAKAKVQRRVSALTGMLTQLIKEQTDVLKQSQKYAEQKTNVGDTLIDRQDELALDLTDFVDACKRESAAVAGNDDNYSKLLLEVAAACDAKKIRDDMMLASEQLDENKPAAAVPHQTTALEKLRELQNMLDEVMAADEMEHEEQLLEAIVEAKERMQKIKEVHQKAVESMEMVKDQLDKSDKDFDVLEEEYEELVKNTKEALLQVPTDLNIFMELNVANDIVEDVFSVFEEVEQKPGSEKMDKGDVEERALAKREEYLEGMEEAEDRMDELEQWLMDKPDSLKVTTEAFDQEEMPEAGIALGALKTEAEDLIGDLMEKDEEMSEEADDGAINTSVPDMVPGDEVKEGDVASFAAQGKSGNETPDHKEQDGRSNVGRQGMSVGETAAGSGTINEGDSDIEERRTQDPTQSGQVDVEGEDVQTKATGGGKLGTGKADDVGMSGGVERMDSNEAGSSEGMEAMMAQQADAMFAKASMQNVRAGSLKDAAHHLRQASDAVAKGNIAQLKEHRRMAAAAMKRAKAEIDAARTGSFTVDETPSLLDDVVEGGAEQAPPKYRDMVSEYYKILNSAL